MLQKTEFYSKIALADYGIRYIFAGNFTGSYVYFKELLEWLKILFSIELFCLDLSDKRKDFIPI